MEEILSLAYEEIRKSNYYHLMAAGVVLTGGGSMLDGTVELAEEIFDMPVKLGIPNGFSGLTDMASTPMHATGVGLVHYGLVHKHNNDELMGQNEHGLFDWVMARMRRWFSGLNHLESRKN